MKRLEYASAPCRRGAIPYARLGIDFAQGGQPWYAVRRDEMKVTT